MQDVDRILTSHVGSLIRPPELNGILRRRYDGEDVSESEYLATLRKAVSDIVRRQADVGIDIVNDGEFGKGGGWARYVLGRLVGFESRSVADGVIGPRALMGKDRRDFADFYAEYEPTQGARRSATWVVTGPIGYRGQREVQRDIESLRLALNEVDHVDAFIPAVAPGSVAPEREDEFYDSPEAALFAIAEALNEEYRAIVDAGFIVQVDDAYIAAYYDVIVPPGTLAEYRRWAEIRVEASNIALRGIPSDRSRYHVCWGSWNGPHTNDVPLKEIVDLILKINVGGYALEMANPRHEHEWRVWEQVKLPDGKILLPGVVSHCTNVVEHPELVCERIVRLAKLVGRERVIASTDCGFSQMDFVQRVHPSIQWAKLSALVEGARLATKELWGRAAGS